MDFSALLQDGRLDEALAACQGEVRQRPADVDARVRLFALECILGRLDKAQQHLESVASLDAKWILPARANSGLIARERARREVFAGRAQPTIVGNPEAWVAWYVCALALEAAGQAEEARDLRVQAWDAAPAVAACVNGQACEWLADADPRLGPIIEAHLLNGYQWVPLSQLRAITLRPPEVLVDLVWLPVKLRLQNDAEVDAHVPVRYPNTEACDTNDLKLARATAWQTSEGGGTFGVGQKLFDSDQGTFALMECRTIEFPPATEAST